MTTEKKEFKREKRYYVAKVRDCHQALTGPETAQLAMLCAKVDEWRRNNSKGALETVCIESDWPIFDAAWALVEAVWNERENNVSGRSAR